MFQRLNSSAKSFSAGLVAILLGQAASGVVALVTEVAYARVLGPSARGLVSICFMSMTFGALIGGAGGEGSIVYWSSRERGNHSSWFPAAMLWGVLGSACACAIWWLAFWKLRLAFLRGIPEGLAWLVALGIPLAVGFAYSMALFTGTEQFASRSTAALSRQLATIAFFFLALLVVGRNASAALLGMVGGFLFASCASVCLFRKELSGFWRLEAAAHNLKPMLSYGLRGQIGNLAAFFTYRLDVFVINFFLPLAELGYYVLGVTVSEALWQIPAAVASALFPRTARTSAETATEFTCLAMRQVFLVTLVCGILLAVLCPVLIPLVFGARFQPSVAIILWLLPGTIALSVAKVACSDLAGRGKNGYSSVFSMVCLVLTVALDWWLIPKKGITGAAIASSLAYFADSVLILAVLSRELSVNWRKLLIPFPPDLAYYRSAWLRGRNAISSFRKRADFDPQVAATKGD
jgi:O-antigen/teichoic acid export membrane protein